jgi:hypothetical protein
MNPDAARRARRKAIAEDLRRALTDEEASPPEWLDLFGDTRDAIAEIRSDLEAETARFVDEPDIRRALARRDRIAANVTERVNAVNIKIRRMNLLAPDSRFTRVTIDADALLRPLYRSTRRRPD